LLSAKVNEGL